jgi:hypothetical protein
MPAPVWTPARRWLLGLLLLLGVLRLGYVVLHEPLAGFANQFDMLRITGCLGLVPDWPVAEGVATPAAPIPRYRSGAPYNAACLPGSELVFAALTVGIDRLADALGAGATGELPLRLHGGIKALLILLAWSGMQWALRPAPGLAIGHAAAVALLLLDPFNTLYLAGFYTEASALIGAWLALALPLVWIARGGEPGWAGGLALALALAFLLGSRMQHLLLPFLWVAWLVVCAWRWRWRLGPILVPALLLLPLVLIGQLLAASSQPSIRAANTQNALFGAVLPAASDPQQMTARLGLPAACAELVHTTWYVRRGRDAQSECPEAFAASARPQWLMALLAEPAAMARLVGRGIALSGQWRPAYLGELAGREYARLPAGPLGLGLSLADAVAHWPWWGLWCLWTLPALLLAPALLRGAGDSSDRPLEWLAPPLVASVVVGWGVSLIGDGYSELARHLHLSANAALLACGLLTLTLLRRPSWRVGLCWLAGLGGIALAGAWVERSGIAYGFLEAPADDRGLQPGVSLRGWALDARGVRAVLAVTADGRRIDLKLSPFPLLSAYYGAGVGATAVRFEGEWPAVAAQDVAIVVVPAVGAETVIDRRFVR